MYEHSLNIHSWCTWESTTNLSMWYIAPASWNGTGLIPQENTVPMISPIIHDTAAATEEIKDSTIMTLRLQSSEAFTSRNMTDRPRSQIPTPRHGCRPPESVAAWGLARTSTHPVEGVSQASHQTRVCP